MTMDGLWKSMAAMLGLLGWVACGPAWAEDTSSRAPSFGTWGVEAQFISGKVAAGDDFYRHVNLGWLESAAIPTGFPMAGSFVRLMLQTEKQLQSIVEHAQAGPLVAGEPAQQVADLYASFMDTKRRDALGISTLAGQIADLMQVSSRREIARRMGQVGYPSILGVAVAPDAQAPDRYLLSIQQSGLGLPREYYLLQTEPYLGTRLAYRDYIAGVFNRAGIPHAQARADAVLNFEKKLAAVHWTPEQSRDALKTYHPLTVGALKTYAPGIDWKALLGASGFGAVTTVNLTQDSAIKREAALFAATPVGTLRSYLVFSFLNSRAPLLSREWADAHFEFFGRRMAGISEQRPLDKRALDLVQRATAEQVGRLYVERYFPAESKVAIDKLVTFLLAACRERLQHSEWMDPQTMAAAVAKLDAVTVKIGFPDRWHDLRAIRIAPDDLLGNLTRIEAWRQQDAQAKLREPVRKWEWDPVVMPHVINAYYNAAGNEIVFPAAILQPPFFDPKADPAVNFGAIGMVIGHEISHGFDDQGNRYDGQGRLRNWWTDASRRGFTQRAERLAAQYDQYEPLPGLPLNGHLTLGENIGDMGGLAIAWTGYQRLIAKDYQGHAPVIDGYTGEQRFFLGYAQLWRSLYVDGFLRNVTLTDPHSPGPFRVNGVLRNFTPWYDAFGVTPQHQLYLPPDQRISIW
ncbi:M13 family metallopeptidase [Aquabacterium sp.]|uniref:M13 family metallopeptidase n=1 Tax=Aquabacterium sp. TaxID=1872578 RepID=UPI0035B3C7C4